MQSFIRAVGDYLMPTLHDSNFGKTGMLTPREFELAGGFLVYKCPTWRWQKAECGTRPYLAPDCQYLYTQAVSMARADDSGGSVHPIPASDFGVIEGSPAADQHPRFYELYITYDNYYRTPRLWLHASTPNQEPIAPRLVLQDISAEHANKTVTIEPFPFKKNLLCASIHPCRHAAVMKRMIARHCNSDGSGSPDRRDGSASRELRVDQYLVLFLKFMSSVIPTIEYDYTMAI